MREGKYVDEVYRTFCKLPDDDPNALVHLMWIANQVAHAHPVWYERFRLRVMWRKLMGDVRDVLKFLGDEQRKKRVNRIAYVVLSIILLLGAFGLLVLSVWPTKL